MGTNNPLGLRFPACLIFSPLRKGVWHPERVSGAPNPTLCLCFESANSCEAFGPQEGLKVKPAAAGSTTLSAHTGSGIPPTGEQSFSGEQKPRRVRVGQKLCEQVLHLGISTSSRPLATSCSPEALIGGVCSDKNCQHLPSGPFHPCVVPSHPPHVRIVASGGEAVGRAMPIQGHAVLRDL